MKARVTVLGSGTSHGVPMIGCSCDVCRSADARDRRSRASIYLDVDGGPKLLVDTSTDLRQQALTHGIMRVDAILFTHSHADHVMGLDDSRRFSQMQKGAIPCYADASTVASLRRSFYYVFDPASEKGGGLPQIELHTIDGRFAVDGLVIQPIPLMHGERPILGFRFGDFAYMTDTNRVPEQAWPLLDGVQTIILGALRHRPHPTHFTVAEALGVVARLQPRQTYLTHICHDLPHAATNQALPPGVELAYDGLTFEIEAAPSLAQVTEGRQWT
ncbi:MAG TPA: MBL fold metallo-hydrolase [Vicinamibacterales bacterium]|nr:MBL fold metallo-hydrolase [Vicinamibacterales bacterium]